jgi:1-deoxy-D-xylulose-5-phosphate synthase
VVNARFIKPLDHELLTTLVSGHQHIVTVEENVLSGGFGSQVAQYLIANNIAYGRISQFGIPDDFIEHGSRTILLDNIQLSPEAIKSNCQQLLSGDLKKTINTSKSDKMMV